MSSSIQTCFRQPHEAAPAEGARDGATVGTTSGCPPRRGFASATSPLPAARAMQASRCGSRVRLNLFQPSRARPLIPHLSHSCDSSHDPVTAAHRRCEQLKRPTQRSQSTHSTSRPPNNHCCSKARSACSTRLLARLRRGGNGGGNGSRRTLNGMGEGSWRTRRMRGRRDTLTASSSSIARCLSGTECGKRWLPEVRRARAIPFSAR